MADWFVIRLPSESHFVFYVFWETNHSMNLKTITTDEKQESKRWLTKQTVYKRGL